MIDVHHHEVRAAVLFQVRRHAQQVSVALRGPLAARNERRFRQADVGSERELAILARLLIDHYPRTAGSHRVEESVAVVHGVIAVVLTGQRAADFRIQPLVSVCMDLLSRKIHGHAHDMAVGLGRIPFFVQLREKRELVRLPAVHIPEDLLPVGPVAHGMRRHVAGALEPAQILAVAAATHHSHPRW